MDFVIDEFTVYFWKKKGGGGGNKDKCCGSIGQSKDLKPKLTERSV